MDDRLVNLDNICDFLFLHYRGQKDILCLYNIAAYHSELEMITHVTRKMMTKIYINHKATFSHSHGDKLKLIKSKPITLSSTIFIQSISKPIEDHMAICTMPILILQES